MSFQIRPMKQDDTPAVFSLVHGSHPCRVLSEDAMRWRFDNVPAEATETHLIAVEGDGTVVGFLRSRLRHPDGGPSSGLSFLTAVAPSHLGTDVGTRLLKASERNLLDGGARTLRTEAAQEAVQVGGEVFRREVLDLGYELEGTHHVLGLELAGVPDAPPAPEGVELRPLSEYAADPRTVYEIDQLTTADEPGVAPGDAFVPYEDWLSGVWGHPLSDPDLSLLVLVDGVPVAFTCYVSDRDTRMESSMTGTLREYQGRGLAGYAKNVALERARKRGFTHAYTGNHADNAPMLAINARLGYTLVGTEGTYVKRVGG